MIRTAIYARALRGAIEGVGLRGAFAIRAHLYPHQQATVRALLTAPELRHLLIGPPGSGKTIQALMVLNALKRLSPELTTLIITPDAQLSAQWVRELTWSLRAPLNDNNQHDELWDAPNARTRVQLNPYDHDLVTVRTHNQIPNVDFVRQFDFVIIDEAHQINVETLNRVYLAHPERLLMLTATPPHRARGPEQADKLYHLTRLIEPERWRSAEAQGATPNEWLDELFAPELSPLARVLYTAHQPAHREVKAIEYDPLKAERLAEALALQLDEIAGDNLALRRAIFENTLKGPWALRRYMMNNLQQHILGVGELVDQAQAELPYHDSLRAMSPDRIGRGRALCDLLALLGVVGDLPTPVLISTNDAPSTKLVRSWLTSELEVPLSRVRVITQAQNPQGGGVEVAIQNHIDQEALVVILQGNGEGLNLQRARHLVFFSLPRSMRQYEQLIGRLDRPGNRALERGEPLMIYLFEERGSRAGRVARSFAAEEGFPCDLEELLASDLEGESELKTHATSPEPYFSEHPTLPWWSLNESNQGAVTQQALCGRLSTRLLEHISCDDPEVYIFQRPAARHQGVLHQYDKDICKRCSFHLTANYGEVPPHPRSDFCECDPPWSLSRVQQQAYGAGELLHGARFSAGVTLFEDLCREASALPVSSGRYSWRLPHPLYERYTMEGDARLLGLIERYDPLSTFEGEVPSAASVAFPPIITFKAHLTNQFEEPHETPRDLLLSALALNWAQRLILLEAGAWSVIYEGHFNNLRGDSQDQAREAWEGGLYLIKNNLTALQARIAPLEMGDPYRTRHELEIQRYIDVIAHIKGQLNNVEPVESIQIELQLEELP